MRKKIKILSRMKITNPQIFSADKFETGIITKERRKEETKRC